MFKPMNPNLALWLERRAVLQPERQSIVYWYDGEHAEEWHYRELNQAVQQFAAWLTRQGVQAGDRVAFLDVNDARYVVVMFAAARIGAVFVPLNFRLSTSEAVATMADCQASVLVYGGDFDATAQAALAQDHSLQIVRSCRSSEDEFDAILKAQRLESVALYDADWDETAWLLYTSGSTGAPKGVALSHGNIFWNTINIILIQGGFSTDSVLISAPLFHAAPVATLMESFLRGAKIHLECSFDAKRLLRRIAEEKVQIVAGVPAMYKLMAADDAFESTDLSCLRAVVVGGAPVPEALIRLYNQRDVRVIQRYGLTEAAPLVTALPWEASTHQQMGAGLPPVFGDVRLMTEGGMLAQVGEVGEIEAAGPNVMQGYWGREAETQAVLSPDGWLRTGDLGIQDEAGYLTVVGRKKDMIISGGENVYATEVEAKLVENTRILECAVIGVPDEKWGELVCAVVSLKQGNTASEADIIEGLQGRLARYKQPKRVIFMDSLPKNGAGKIDKLKLRQQIVVEA